MAVQTQQLSADVCSYQSIMIQEMNEKNPDTKEAPYDQLFESYISMTTDYVYKAAFATVMFFMCWPWAALFWPPYYFMRRASQ